MKKSRILWRFGIKCILALMCVSICPKAFATVAKQEQCDYYALNSVTVNSGEVNEPQFSEKTLLAAENDQENNSALEYFDASKYYYIQLTEIERTIYDSLLAELDMYTMPEDASVDIEVGSGYSEEDILRYIKRAYFAFITDNPWYAALFYTYGLDDIYDGETVHMRFFPNQIASQYNINKAKFKLDQILESIDSSGDNYSKLSQLLDMRRETMQYDPYYNFYGQDLSYSITVFGCLIKQYAICDGFADLVKLICDNLDIPCIIVGNAGHEWNFIQMEDGQWYSCDFTSTPDQLQLFGSSDNGYSSESSYRISELYIGEPGFFVFPTLAETSYSYKGDGQLDYVEKERTFTEPEGTYLYSIHEDGVSCTITGYCGAESGDLSIPTEIDGYVVTEIGESAFYAQNNFTGSIIIPDTVLVIGDGAFKNCVNLRGTLTLGQNVINIGKYAFVGCAGLSGELSFPETLRSIGREAFYDCTGFTGDLRLPAGLECFEHSFYNCSGLSGTLYLPDGVLFDAVNVIRSNFQSVWVSYDNEYYSCFDGVSVGRN